MGHELGSGFVQAAEIARISKGQGNSGHQPLVRLRRAVASTPSAPRRVNWEGSGTAVAETREKPVPIAQFGPV